MKTTSKDFELFKSECEKWIEKFQLNSWEILFHHQNPSNKRADCSVGKDVVYRRADVRFSIDNFDEKDCNKEYFKSVAKHEMLHILLSGITNLAYDRFINEESLIQAEEELVRKLENIIL